jgi:hypothetical protein
VKRIIFALFCLFCATQAQARGALPSHNPHEALLCLCPLDCQPVAFAAWSTRKLSCVYTGPALRVQRASDSTTQDIGFSATRDLDNTSLLSFCAATNCFVIKWYDQSGSLGNCNVGQPCDLGVPAFGAPGRPQIVSAGAVTTTIGGKTALNNTPGPNDGTGTFLFNPAMTFPVATSFTGITVGRPTSAGASGFNGRGVMADAGFFGLNIITGAPCAVNCFVATKRGYADLIYLAYTLSTDAIFATRFNSADTVPFKAYLNGTTGTNANSINSGGGTPIVYMGTNTGGLSQQDMAGPMGEGILFTQELSIDQMNRLGANIAAYWGPTWTPITQ